jgi:hypothetical protein
VRRVSAQAGGGVVVTCDLFVGRSRARRRYCTR